MISDELRDTWAAEGLRAGRDGYIGRRLQAVSCFEAYAGLDAAGTRRFVALRLDPAERRNIADRYPRSSKGISVETVEGGERTAVFLREVAGIPASVFEAVVADVLAAGTSGRSGAELRTAVERFASWQRALSREAESGAALEVRGILGELVVIRDILLPLLGVARTLQTWRAPASDHIHDFVGQGWELEIKTILTPGSSIHVNTDRQLEAEPGHRMLLGCVEVESDPEGLSLTDHVKQLLEALASDPEGREHLRNAVIQRGALAAAVSDEAAKRYRLVSIESFDVKVGFPIIPSGSLVRGVSSVRYQIGLMHCAPFKISMPDMNAFIATAEHTK